VTTRQHKGRTIAAIFTHVHNVRSKSVRFQPRTENSTMAQPAHCTPQLIRAGLAESAARRAEMLGACRGLVKKFRRDGWAAPMPVGQEMLYYMLCQQAHHRGQVRVLAHQLGFQWKERGSPGEPSLATILNEYLKGTGRGRQASDGIRVEYDIEVILPRLRKRHMHLWFLGVSIGDLSERSGLIS
jgi:hypothetical protein